MKNKLFRIDEEGSIFYFGAWIGKAAYHDLGDGKGVQIYTSLNKRDVYIMAKHLSSLQRLLLRAAKEGMKFIPSTTKHKPKP